MKKFTTLVIIVLLFLVLLFASAQQGCEMSGGGRGTTEAKKFGLDYSLVSGIDYLTSGKTVQQGESFYVGVRIENYDREARSGELCISDNVADTYGGISSQEDGECKFFNVAAADVIKKESSGLFGKSITEEITPGKVDVYFPENGLYSYSGLPSSQQPWPQMFYVSLRYRQKSQVTGTVSVPTPGYETIALIQEPAPLVLGITKSVHRIQDAYKVDLEMRLAKSQQQAKILAYDFSQENITYFMTELAPQKLNCYLTSGEPIISKVPIENERLIKCSSIMYLGSETQQSYPLVVTLDYGVAIEKSYPFGIKT
ncbi:MAG: hypothetical protein ACPLXC_01095 [Candidatus Pacearchaeota archaeon]